MMGCWDTVERPKMTKEQWQAFITKAADIGIILSVERFTEKSDVDISDSAFLVDYFGLMK
jgi:hypothetical protein